MSRRHVTEADTRVLDARQLELLRARSQSPADARTSQVDADGELTTAWHRTTGTLAADGTATRCTRLVRRRPPAGSAQSALTVDLVQCTAGTTVSERGTGRQPLLRRLAASRGAWPSRRLAVLLTAAATTFGTALTVWRGSQPALPTAVETTHASVAAPRVDTAVESVGWKAHTSRPAATPAAASADARTPATMAPSAAERPSEPGGSAAATGAHGARPSPGARAAGDVTDVTRLAATELAAGNYPAALARYRGLAMHGADGPVHAEISRILARRLAERCGSDCQENAQ